MIGEFTGMVVATALGWGNAAQIATAIALAYLFGFALTARPPVAAGLGAAAVVSTALAADTISITITEAIDNLTILLIPGALHAGLGDPLFYGSVAAGFGLPSRSPFSQPLPDRTRQGPRRGPPPRRVGRRNRRPDGSPRRFATSARPGSSGRSAGGASRVLR